MKLPKGIRPRGNALLVDATHEGQRRTATIKLEDFGGDLAAALKAAEIKKDELTLAMKKGEVAPVADSGVWSIRKAFERTCDVEWGGGVVLKEHEDGTLAFDGKQTEGGTAGQRRNGLVAVNFFKPGTKLHRIDLNRIDEWVAHSRKIGNSDSTLNKKLSALSLMFKTAKARKGCEEVPVMPRTKEKNGRIRFVSPAEEALILQTLKLWSLEDEREAVIVLVDTGARTTELLNLEARDIDFNQGNGVASIWETKADLPRSVPLTKRAAAIIARRCNEHPTGKLFPFGSKQYLREAWERLRSHMKLTEDEQFVPHCLRHTCASRLVQRGVDLRRVKDWMGHKTILTTMRYAHLAPKDLLQAVAVLEPA